MNAAAKLFVTVDGPSTRDIDDAFALERTHSGWRLFVAIAVPAAHVAPGTSLDVAARRLAATVYSSTRVVKSMLPLVLSEDLCSLTASVDREAMVITIEIGADLSVTSTEITFESITVAHRLTYEDVPRLSQDSSHGSLFTLMQDAISLSKALLDNRRSSGALAFFDLSKLLYLDEEGAMRRAASAGDMIGHIVVQEFMVLTNTQVARWAIEREIPFVYRTHRAKLAAPPAAELLETIQTWGNDPQRASQSEESLMERLSVIMGAAVYAPHALGHYALNLPYYAHCTSPLRRYVDLVNQRQIRAHCLNVEPPHSQEEITEISNGINDTLAQAKIARSQSFKGAVIDRASRAVESGQIERMGDPELVQAIKLSVSSGAMPEPLANHLANKIALGTLPDKVLDVLVTASTSLNLPESLLAAWSEFMAAAPHRAKHFVMFALQTGLAADHAASDQALDGVGFDVSVRLRRVCDNVVHITSAAATRKKDAENLASARLMCSFMGATGIPSQPPEGMASTAVLSSVAPAASPAGDGAPRRNYKGELLEFCQKRKLQPPVFEIYVTGPPNDARFTCKARLEFGEEVPTVLFKDARTKKEAEAGAAQKLLPEIGQG